MENLAENAWTATSDGRLVTYLPVVDSHGVDRAVALGDAQPLFVQVKAHRRARPGDRLAFAIPTHEIGGYQRWIALLLAGDPEAIREAYAVPGPDLLARGEPGTLVDGRPCIHATLSPTSPTWSPFAVAPDDLGPRLESLAAAPGVAAGPPLEREPTQEEGAFFEESVVAALLAAGDGLAPYRPSVDLGRDLLVQHAGTDAAVYLQVKGTEREDRPGLVRFQVRRRTFAPLPTLLFLFAYADPRTHRVDPVWLVPAPALAERAGGGDPEHLSFEAHRRGADPRWENERTSLAELAARLKSLL